LDDRELFVLYTGIRWEFLPRELGFGSGMACWRRLRDWNDAGVWQRLHELPLAELRAADLLDFSRAVEGAIALPHWFRRPRIRWEIRDDIHEALLTLGCAVICWRRLRDRL
jgi:transposase